MDLQEQRITCLRMAVDLGCKSNSVFGMAVDLMGFVASGRVPSSTGQQEEKSAEAIAACGTELPASEAAGLTAVQLEVPTAAADPPTLPPGEPVAPAAAVAAETAPVIETAPPSEGHGEAPAAEPIAAEAAQPAAAAPPVEAAKEEAASAPSTASR